MTNPTRLRVLPHVPRASAVRKPLLCVPYAGGGAMSYDSWHQLLPPAIQPMTLRLPGRGVRADEPLPSDLKGLAADIAAELRPHLTGRFGLFGHSMGALVAYEIALALRASHGIEPACLIVSGMRAPDRLRGTTRYSHLGDADLRSAIGGMGGTDAGVLDDPELWELFVPIIRSDLALCDAYTPTPAEPLRYPIVAYGSRNDPELDQDLMNGWAGFTTGPFASRMFPGDHFYFLRWPEAFAMDLINRLHQHLLDAGR
jgi:medium-chain acyl-[acyl-carrier-protein] hydrolase